MHDLVIRGGTVIDGTGGAARRADVAVDGQHIVDVGDDVGRGHRVIDADGLLVTPGFVDIHTHFDGQATWDRLLAPSCWHGVTSVVMGNCGVGFAPARRDHHAFLIRLLEGVEDIPGTALTEGLTWNWEGFPEYLDELGRQSYTIDLGAQIPHAPLRAFVMGERGADTDEQPTEDELAAMADLVAEGMAAGAVGFATSRGRNHRTSDGNPIGTLRAGDRELLACAGALARDGRGVLQMVSDFYRSTDDDYTAHEMALIEAMATAAGRPMSFSVQEDGACPDKWRDVLAWAESAGARGLTLRPQVFVRPFGVMLGLQGSVNPFGVCPSFATITALPLPQKVAAMCDPEVRHRLLAEHAAYAGRGGLGVTRKLATDFDLMFRLDDPVDYHLDAEKAIGVQARRTGVDPTEAVYDALLELDGRRFLYFPLLNFAHRNFDALAEMVAAPNALFGLSDAGAHCGAVSDASHTTSTFITWHRDRRDGPPIDLPWLVYGHTLRNARHVGWHDRGAVLPGHLADLNLIDLDALACPHPEMAYDLPAGGGRLVQRAEGYRATIKSGQVTFEFGQHTGALPGSLVRGDQRPLQPA
jgi:N-acyl-D-amino-acid deacylase